ncbi:MAG: nicotinate (nicotinamide) nucleotide adenylyltransferase [Phycisphaerales bacterium]|nr:nicotinate (nicotinamide) nucleotide adenylyltransferase [Phycisphaerales bacterium]
MSHTLLYGGTFDPIHHGHLIVCQRARELLVADEVLLIPASVSPHKMVGHVKSATPAAHRLAMLRLAVENIPHFTVDPRELFRAGPSYTADTLDELRREHPNTRFTLLLGADQLPKFHTWVRVQDILAPTPLRDIAILGRPFGDKDPTITLSSGLAAVREHLGPDVAARFEEAVLPTPLIEISATDVRNRVREHLPIHYLVPPAVEAYIRTHDLYPTPGRAKG